MIGALVVLALLCPHCETLRKAAEPETALDIVFLPDGFTAAQLPVFRCTTDLLKEQLLRIPPFDDPRRLLNLHRVDLVSDGPSGEVAGGCKDVCQRINPVLPSSCAGDLSGYARSRDSDGSIPVLRLGAELCGGGGQSRCEFMSLSEAARAAAVAHASEAPAADIVVVVVNAGTEGGVMKFAPRTVATDTGTMTLYDGEPPLAVVTLDGINGDGCVNRLAHELGHALRLEDEYDQGSFVDGATAGAIPCGPNVTDPVACASDPTYGAVPWDQACTYKNATNCSSLQTQAAESCGVVRDSTCCANDSGSVDHQIPHPGMDHIGLFEGAYYETCKAYRPSYACRMRSNHDLFCPVCIAEMESAIPAGEACVVMSARGGIGLLETNYSDAFVGESLPAARWTDPLIRAFRHAKGRRFRALVDLGGTKAWIPIKEARIESRIAPWDLAPDGRVEVRLKRRMKGTVPRFEVSSRGVAPAPRPRPPVPPPLPLPPTGRPPIEIPRVRIDVIDLIGNARKAEQLDACYETRSYVE